jgi:ABC-2 type transport system ATP-binding protein
MAEALLEVLGITRTYGKVRAVQDLTFSLDAGQVFGFIGPNGAGKTTTMRILATLDLPDEGDARIGGLSVLAHPREVRRSVGFMSDQFVPHANLTVTQFLDFSARAQGLRGRRRIDTVRSVSSFCGLGDFSDRPATGLSKGMGQRLHLAKTLLHDPSLLVLDEPTAGLDPRARIEFRDLLSELKAAGKGILISSHILSELSESCDGIVVIERGRKVVSGGIEEIHRSLTPHRRVLLRAERDAPRALEWLVVQPHVRDASIDGERLRFDLEGDDAVLADLVQAAVAAGIRVCELRLEQADLEDIFLRTTAGKLQ